MNDNTKEISQLIEENKKLRQFIKLFDNMCSNALYNLKQQTDSHIRRDVIMSSFSNMYAHTQTILREHLNETTPPSV